jgi:Nop53 (60S ribosomal biogenesis)
VQADAETKEACKPPKLGRHKFTPLPVQVLASDDVNGSLRRLKTTPLVTKDRFKSLQKRGMIQVRNTGIPQWQGAASAPSWGCTDWAAMCVGHVLAPGQFVHRPVVTKHAIPSIQSLLPAGPDGHELCWERNQTNGRALCAHGSRRCSSKRSGRHSKRTYTHVRMFACMGRRRCVTAIACAGDSEAALEQAHHQTREDIREACDQGEATRVA